MAETPALRPMLLFVHGTEDGPMPSLEWAQRRAGIVPDCDMGFDPKSPNREKWLHRDGPIGRHFERRKRASSARKPFSRFDLAHWKGERWWQEEGYAHRTLCEMISPSDGDDLVYAAFTWSGANREAERSSAARDLNSAIREHVSRGFAPHIIAHSHGGNIVRAAGQLSPRTFRHVRSVTTIGAPFFHYSAWSVVFNALGLLIAAVGLAALSWLYFHSASLTSVSPTLPSAELMWAFLRLLPLGVLASLAIFCLFYALEFVSYLWTARRTYFSTPVRVPWHAVFTDLDEAILGLATLNRPVRIFSARYTRPLSGPLGFMPSALVVLFVGFALVVFAPEALAYQFYQIQHAGAQLGLWAVPQAAPPLPPFSWRPLVALAGWPLAILTALAISLALYAISLANANLLNQITLTQLRAKAFGDFDNVGIARVERYPWRGGEHLATPLPKHVADDIEDAVRIGAFYFYGRFRDAMKPGANEYERDIVALITASLTWDELAHTTYLRSDAFLEYLARDILAATGDFRFTPLPEIQEESA